MGFDVARAHERCARGGSLQTFTTTANRRPDNTG